MPKTLIIVCGEDERKYATYLQQLVSSIDDAGDERVGTKDGAVTASIFSEQQYIDSLVKMTSANYVLFVGDGSVAKAARANMAERYGKFGMHYGWLGRQAFMYADPAELKKDAVADFKSFCEGYGKPFDLAFGNEGAQVQPSDPPADDEVGGAAGAVRALVGLARNRAEAVREFAKDIRFEVLSRKDVRDQQYTMLTLVLYLEGLSDFLAG